MRCAPNRRSGARATAPSGLRLIGARCGLRRAGEVGDIQQQVRRAHRPASPRRRRTARRRGLRQQPPRGRVPAPAARQSRAARGPRGSPVFPRPRRRLATGSTRSARGRGRGLQAIEHDHRCRGRKQRVRPCADAARSNRSFSSTITGRGRVRAGQPPHSRARRRPATPARGCSPPAETARGARAGQVPPRSRLPPRPARQGRGPRRR